MNPELEPTPRPSNKQQVAPGVTDVLTQMQRSRRIHFMTSLPKTAFQTSSDSRQTAQLSLPPEFVQENGRKFEDWVILRAHLSSGRSSRPWVVQLKTNVGPSEAVEVQFAGGWPHFVAVNRLKEGDYLIFVLKEDARSEFEVYMFRGPWGTQYSPDEGEESDPEEDEEVDVLESEAESEENDSEYFPNEGDRPEPEFEDNNQIRLHDSPVHQQEEHNQAFTTGDIREVNPAPVQRTGTPSMHPGFSRRLKAFNIGLADGRPNSGQFEFPKAFIRAHGGHVLGSVNFQGVHENSRSYAITIRRRPRDHLQVYCNTREWSRFVHDNGLKEGHMLQFSLVATSHFKVRKIS